MSSDGERIANPLVRILRFGENLPSQTDEAQQCSHSEMVECISVRGGARHRNLEPQSRSLTYAALCSPRPAHHDRHVTHHHRRAREPDNPRAGLRLAPRRSRSAPRLALLTSHASDHRSCRALRLGGPASDGRNVAFSSAASKASAVTHPIASPLAAVALPAGSSPVGRH